MNLRISGLFSILFIAGGLTVKGQQRLPVLKADFQSASVKTKGNELVVSTGKVQRTWKWTGKGLVTTSFKNAKTGKDWAEMKPKFSSDWAYYGLIDEKAGKLISLTTKQGNDDGFTSNYLEVIAEVEYPSVESFIKYQIWAYPNAPGIFTRVWFKGKGGKNFKSASLAANERVSIKQLSGENQKPYLNITVPTWAVSQTADPKFVEYHITDIDPKKDYVLGLSWWSSDKKSRKQKVRVTSVDGESQAELKIGRAHV